MYYVVVCFPESQKLYDQDWFNECHLINDENGLDKFGSQAYFVPLEYYNQLFKNE